MWSKSEAGCSHTPSVSMSVPPNPTVYSKVRVSVPEPSPVQAIFLRLFARKMSSAPRSSHSHTLRLSPPLATVTGWLQVTLRLDGLTDPEGVPRSRATK